MCRTCGTRVGVIAPSVISLAEAGMGFEDHQDIEAVGVDRHELISWAIHNLMAAAGDGIKHKQPSVTVGAVRELDALLGLGINSNRGNRYGWRR